jgi:predicted N-acetyltransferase YhbS
VSFRIEPLGRQDRSVFESGSKELDTYFRNHVSQDIRRNLASCYVALDDEDRIVGYYTLSATSLSLAALPPARARKLPRYSDIPAMLIGRLAVSTPHQGKGLGGALVFDAAERAMRSGIAAYALAADPKDGRAAAFYAKLGFERLGAGARMIRAFAGNPLAK